jgi:hypothetical protein
VKYNLANTISNPITKLVKQTNQVKKNTKGKQQQEAKESSNGFQQQTQQEHYHDSKQKQDMNVTKYPKQQHKTRDQQARRRVLQRLLQETQASSDNQTGRALKH